MSTLKIKDADGTDQYLNVIGVGNASEPFQSVVPDYRIPYAINQIFKDDAVTVSVAEKGKSLVKFGTNPLLASGVEETVWSTGGIETYETTNAIDEVVSSNAGDTQDIVIEGHTISGSDLTFVSQTATLTGTTAAVLTTPLARVTRIYNDDNTDFLGNITVYVNGGNTHLTALIGNNQSLKCSTALSSVDYWLITGFDMSVNRSNTANVDFKLQIRESGKVFRTQYFASQANGASYFTFDQAIIVRPNSDIRVQATSNAASTSVSASIHGYLAIIT